MTATATAPAKSAGKKDQKKLRIGFIGTGMIAGAHLRALATMPDVEVVGLCDNLAERAEQMAEEFGVSTDAVFTDYRKMLDKVELDAVSVCTPNGVHLDPTVKALQAGAHVLVEKPMAMNAGECKKMIAASKKADRKLVIGFQYRFDAKTRYLCDLRDAGVFGDIKFGRVWALRRRGIPNWGVFGQKHLQGGGPMIDIGVHVLEMCHYTMGSPKPVAATGMIDTYLGNDQKAAQIKTDWSGWDWKTYTVEDLAIGSIRFDNGAVIHIEATFAGHHEHNGTMDFQIMGTKGGGKWGTSEVFTDMHNYMVDIKPAFLPREGGMGGGGGNAKNFFTLKLRDFVDHCLYGKESTAPAEHGLMVQQMLDGVYASAAKGGKEVEIK